MKSFSILMPSMQVILQSPFDIFIQFIKTLSLFRPFRSTLIEWLEISLLLLSHSLKKPSNVDNLIVFSLNHHVPMVESEVSL